MEISEKTKRAYNDTKVSARRDPDSIEIILAEFARDTLARALRAEWGKDHPMPNATTCNGCGLTDSRHDRTDADWLRAADEMLRGEPK